MSLTLHHDDSPAARGKAGAGASMRQRILAKDRPGTHSPCEAQRNAGVACQVHPLPVCVDASSEVILGVDTPRSPESFAAHSDGGNSIRCCFNIFTSRSHTSSAVG